MELSDRDISRIADAVVAKLRATEEAKLDADFLATRSIEEMKEIGRRKLKRASRKQEAA